MEKDKMLVLSEGHRKRIRNRFKNASDSFYDYELLELLLFYAIPRKNTKEIAHRLMQTFGSLSGVFGTSLSGLCKIEGLGESSAIMLKTIGTVIERIRRCENSGRILEYNSFASIREIVSKYIKDLSEEAFVIIFLDKGMKCIAGKSYKDGKKSTIEASLKEIAECLSNYSPNKLVIAHNHPSGNAEPSENDDYATKRIHLLCQIYDVELIDHVILAERESFSYFASGRLARFKTELNLRTIINKTE